MERQRLVRYFQWRVIVHIPSSQAQLIVRNNVTENSDNVNANANVNISVHYSMTKNSIFIIKAMVITSLYLSTLCIVLLSEAKNTYLAVWRTNNNFC